MISLIFNYFNAVFTWCSNFYNDYVIPFMQKEDTYVINISMLAALGFLVLATRKAPKDKFVGNWVYMTMAILSFGYSLSRVA